jgi:NAD(P)-dependent dehydrogenase (short-subunit alcohol dehydrogenase family)
VFFKPPSHHHLHLNLSSNLSKTETFLPLFPQMGRHHRRLPLLDLPRHQGRAASHDRKGLGPRHQHGIDARSGRVAVQVGVRFFFLLQSLPCLSRGTRCSNPQLSRAERDGNAPDTQARLTERKTREKKPNKKNRYNAAKHGVAGFTKTAALETARSGVTVNAVCPGYVYTDLIKKQVADQARTRGIPVERVIEDVLLVDQPTKKFVKVEEVAAMVRFLCQDDAASVTGACLSVDGGWTAR